MNIYEHIYGESRLRDKIFDCILPTSMLLLRDEMMLCLDKQLFKLGDDKKHFYWTLKGMILWSILPREGVNT